jgi:thiamine-phosphate pyrophosphorylase
MKLQNIDYSLYLVTDRGLARGLSTLEIVSAAVYGGATVVQLREKDCSTRDFIEQGLAIKEFLKDQGVPLIINDRVDVAQAVRADGVHLGQTDMPLEVAKKILGDSMIIGISAESLQTTWASVPFMRPPPKPIRHRPWVWKGCGKFARPSDSRWSASVV